MIDEFLTWVTTYKDNPGVLMWDVGNESVLGLQNCYSGDELERAQRVHHLRQRGRQEDPLDRPQPPGHLDRRLDRRLAVLQGQRPGPGPLRGEHLRATSATSRRLDAGGLHQALHRHRGRPGRLVGGAGRRQRDPDRADRPGRRPTATPRPGTASPAHPGVALGATLFHYGTEDDFGGIWFNLVPDGYKRPSYYAIAKAYGGSAANPGTNTPPRFQSMSINSSTGYRRRRGRHHERGHQRPGR